MGGRRRPYGLRGARTRRRRVPVDVPAARSRSFPLLVGIGVGDTLANVLVAVASTKGSVGIVAVLSALYPVVTVLLARILLQERLTRSKRVGGGIAISGAVLVAAG